jgi:hypothetical protein
MCPRAASQGLPERRNAQKGSRQPDKLGIDCEATGRRKNEHAMATWIVRATAQCARKPGWWNFD